MISDIVSTLTESLGLLDSLLGSALYFPFLLLGTGVFFTFYLKFPQLRFFNHAIRIVLGKYDKDGMPGDATHFQALSTAISGTVGTGNIGGVALAIYLGGPAALFWMWVTAFLGMTTKFVEVTLSHKYRTVDEQGYIAGGPMYVMERRLNMKWLAVFFAIATVVSSFGTGNMPQSNSIASGIETSFGIPAWLTGTALAIALGMVIVGGIKRIGKVASRLVPVMSSIYVAGALFIILWNYDRIADSFYLIFKHAFTPTAATGGFAGATVLYAITWGVRRAAFSNEAGLGSAPIAHAAAKTKEPVREGLVAMMGPLVDTLIICTMTALVIIITGEWTGSADSSVLTKNAFNAGIPYLGGVIVAIGLILFAISTAISWSYYGDRCAEYLFGPRAIPPYRWIYVIALFVGAIVQMEFVWNFSDITLGLMALPNLVAIIALSGVVISLTKDYFSRKHVRTN